MKNLKLRNVCLLLILCIMTLSCVTLQQPLPGSLWGNWSFIKTGTIIDGSNERLYDYRNACHSERDRLHFSSDKKMSLRWYDESCTINYHLIGRYHVENNVLKVTLEENSRYQNSPFPPISEFRIIQINSTTLKLEELPEGYKSNWGKVSAGNKAMVFVFMKLD